VAGSPSTFFIITDYIAQSFQPYRSTRTVKYQDLWITFDSGHLIKRASSLAWSLR